MATTSSYSYRCTTTGISRSELSQVAADHGLYSHIRPLTDDEAVTVSHEDLEPFFPD